MKMCWIMLKPVYASRRVTQYIRQKIRLVLFIACVGLLSIASFSVLFRISPYQFPVCNLTSVTDDIIGYENGFRKDKPLIPSNEQDICVPRSSWKNRLPTPRWPTNLREWSARIFVDCVRFCLQTRLLHRRVMVALSCNKNTSTITTKYTNSANEVFSVPFGDRCLSDVIDTCAKGDKPVPNVIHYIWYGHNKEFKFEHFLSFISAIRYMEPSLILIHGDAIPVGNYWNYLLLISPNIIHVNRPLVTSVYGNTLSYREHGADVMRIEALQRYGGLYLDFDSVILRDVDSLRVHDVTMGRENINNLGNQFIMAKKGARFLQLWHEGYKGYKKRNWGWNSLYVPYNIAMGHPYLIHIEGNRFTRPHFQDRNMIYNENYDWSDNYAMHLYMRDYGRPLDMDIIRTLNTTIGSVSRHVLFGIKELCRN